MSRLGLLLVTLGLAAAVGADAPAAGGTLTGPHRAAIAAARVMLDAVPLPPGAASAPPGDTGANRFLARPLIELFFAAQVTRHRVWTVALTPAGLITWIHRHLPAGARWQGGGFGGDTASGDYTLPSRPRAGLAGGMVSVSAVTAGAGRSLARADAFVPYAAPRPAAQRVPAEAGVLDITIVDGAGRRRGARTVTRRAAIRRLAAAIDALPLANFRGAAFSCPGALTATPIDTFSFRVRPGAPALAMITINARTPTDPDPCASASLTVRGRRIGLAFDAGRVLRLADRLLGLRLARPAA